ncbi:unnamed protein product, partial [Rotaria sp. Silwood2]
HVHKVRAHDTTIAPPTFTEKPVVVVWVVVVVGLVVVG